MKKLLFAFKSIFIIVVALVFLQIMPQTADADGSISTQGGHLTYRNDGNNATITGYVGTGGDITIPATISRGPVNEPFTVIKIGAGAFKETGVITSVTLPNTVTTIGQMAFMNCSGLTSVTIPNSVTTIEQMAFQNCTGLRTVTIPGTLTNVSPALFKGCSGLTNVTIQPGIKTIDQSAFNSCSRLTSIVLPASVTSLDKYAFANCTGLRSITIPAGVKLLPERLFDNCSSLTSVTIPNTVTFIKDCAFYKCTALESITLPDSVREIGGNAFAYSGLKSITIPGNVTHLTAAMFRGCKSLTNVAIPNSVIFIGGDAFDGCSSLRSIVIPDSVYMSEGIFRNCTSLESVKFSAQERSIGSYGFYNCTSLKSITIPEQITYLGDHAFDGCSNLSEANFLADAPYVNDFGIRVFDNCAADFKIKYLSGKIGWSNPFHGYPAEMVFEFPNIDSTVTLPGNINPGALENIPGDIIGSIKITLQAQAGLGNVKLDWNSITDPRGVSGYNIYKSTSTGNQTNTSENQSILTGTTFSDTKVNAGTTYYYVVKPVFRDNTVGEASNEVAATPKGSTGTIQLTIDNPVMNHDGVQKPIDAGFGTAPVIKDGRTFLPIKSLIAEMGGTIEWDGTEKKVTIQYEGKIVDLWIGKKNVRVNGIDKATDVAPYISETGRTMLPLGFVGESLGCEVSWDAATQSVTISNYGIGDTPKVQAGIGTTANTQTTDNIPGNQATGTTTDTGKTQNSASNTSTVSWSGIWDTDWGILELSQVGDKVTGTYDYYEGCEIDGKANGNILTGTFIEKKGTEDEAHGLFEFTMNSDGKIFEGRWGDSDTPKADWFYWNGER